MFSVQEKVEASNESLNQAKREMKTLITGEKLIKSFSEEDFLQLNDLISGNDLRLRLDVNLCNEMAKGKNDRVKLNIDADYYEQSESNWTESSYMSPPRYVICKKPSCYTLLPFNAKKELVCPVCGTTQDSVGPEPTQTDDLDGDGIPDWFEEESEFLSYKYKYDAYEDYDKDGFSNLDEYVAGTDLDDPESYPCLAYNLRVVGKPFNQQLPFQYSRIRKGNSENVTDWKVVFSNGAEAKIGGSIKGYEGYVVRGINPSENPSNTTVTVETPLHEQIIMKKNKPAVENIQSVRLVFMSSKFGAPVPKGGVDLRQTQNQNSVKASTMSRGKAGSGLDYGDSGQSNRVVKDETKIVRIGEEFKLTADKSGLESNKKIVERRTGNKAIYEDEDFTVTEKYRLVAVENVNENKVEYTARIEKLSAKNNREEVLTIRAYNQALDGRKSKSSAYSSGDNY